MSDRGDDCYFFFYSTCTKGAACRFRHCEAALGSETVCALWQAGHCSRRGCADRHMVMDKKRSAIPCYWENQPTGCRKRNCAFHHDRGRYIDGVFLPPSQSSVPSALGSPQAAKAELTVQQGGLAVQPGPCALLQSTPRRKGQSHPHPGVACPGHPPVVVRVACGDEDEDERDMSAKQGEEANTPPPRSTPEVPSGSRTASEQKPAVTLKQEVCSGVSSALLQPPLVPTVATTVTLPSKGAEPLLRPSLAERLGKRKCSAHDDSDPPRKRSRAEPPGEKGGSPERNLDKPAKKLHISKALHERLGGSPGPHRCEAAMRGDKAGDIHVKTLEEILLERAQRKCGELHSELKTPSPSTAEDWAARARASGFRATRMQTRSKGRAENRYGRREGTRWRSRGGSARSTRTDRDTDNRRTGLWQPSPVSEGQWRERARTRKSLQDVHVKTLEEIRLEKALRMQQSAEGGASSQPQPQATPGTRRLLQLPERPAGKDEKKLREGAEMVPQSAITRTVSGETSAEAVGAGAARPPQRWETLTEKHTREQQESGGSHPGKPALPRSREDAASRHACPEKPALRAVARVPRGLTKQLPAKSGPKQEGETTDPRRSKPRAKGAPQSFARKANAEPKANMKPSGANVVSRPAQAPKRKASEMHPEEPAAVKPPRPSSAGAPRRPPAKTVAVATVPPFAEHTPVPVPATTEKPRDSWHLPPSQSSADLHSPGASGLSPSQKAPDTCKASSASAGEAPLPKDDDFQKLVWEMSRANLEDAIDLHPDKDEDELFRELSEMSDS